MFFSASSAVVMHPTLSNNTMDIVIIFNSFLTSADAKDGTIIIVTSRSTTKDMLGCAEVFRTLLR
tara:strand:+ start:382 stop:576 length:195 start_codon:yes stop_codon:yes gene_type:complete